MSFLEDIQADVQAVFLNTNELAQLKTYNGQEIPVVIVQEFTEDDPDTAALRGHRVHKHSLVIAVDRQQVSLPVVYEQVEFDGTLWTVWNVQIEGGTLLIALDKNREKAS